MKIVVAGATGTLGAQLVTAVRAAGHEPSPISRSHGVDVLSGVGLAEALSGAAAVIDATSRQTMSSRKSIEFFGTVTRNLLEAEDAARVPHHVAISIVGAAGIAANYYAGKAVQEELVMAQSGGWSLLRTTQFHDFVKQLIGFGRVGPVQAVPNMVSQPVDVREVADELVAIATGEPRGLQPDLAGPEVVRMADLTRRYLAATGSRRPVVEIPFPGVYGRGMRDGSLLPGDEARLGRRTFDEWLAEHSSERRA